MKDKKHTSKNHLSFEKRTLVELSEKDTVNIGGGQRKDQDNDLGDLLRRLTETKNH